MKLGMMFYRFGALGFLFSAGVFFEEPVKTYLAQDHSSLANLLLLYAFPVLVGFCLLVMTEEFFKQMNSKIALLFTALSVLTFFWLILWWVIWDSMVPSMGNGTDLFLKYIHYLNFIGLGLGLAGLVWGWKTPQPGKRVARFMVATGWIMSYASAMNLHIEPTLHHLMGPGVGGLLVALGALFISRDL